MGNAQSSTKTTDERIAELRQHIWEDASAKRPVVVVVIGDVGSGKSTAHNTAINVCTQRYDEVIAETGQGGARTTRRVRVTPVKIKPSDGGVPVHAFTLVDFPGCSLALQLDHEFLNAVLRGVRHGTGAHTDERMTAEIQSPENEDPANAPDYSIFVIDPLAIQKDKGFFDTIFFRNPGVDTSGAEELSKGAESACRYGTCTSVCWQPLIQRLAFCAHSRLPQCAPRASYSRGANAGKPMVLITKKKHPERKAHTTTESVRAGFRNCIPSSNFFDAEGYTERGMVIPETELEYLCMLAI
eukprot:TRINITY_DN3325_c0_g1_i1.p1 TRINITY_DN3325_c0_g1~~TRINITY_DN3325_c0_g1_i1.p1  ORF type:complete len:299 (+),score=62.17 TRINITY_DN3325_c0_g1_i1:500-1396(+)